MDHDSVYDSEIALVFLLPPLSTTASRQRHAILIRLLVGNMAIMWRNGRTCARSRKIQHAAKNSALKSIFRWKDEIQTIVYISSMHSWWFADCTPLLSSAHHFLHTNLNILESLSSWSLRVNRLEMPLNSAHRRQQMLTVHYAPINTNSLSQCMAGRWRSLIFHLLAMGISVLRASKNPLRPL